MSWASEYIERLRAGETVQFRPRGNSMRGKIESGQLVTVMSACVPHDCEVHQGAIVLCRVNGRPYLHLVKQVQMHGFDERYLIGNNRGGINGWIGRESIYGICTKVED